LISAHERFSLRPCHAGIAARTIGQIVLANTSAPASDA
jgi:hypothetical protein